MTQKLEETIVQSLDRHLDQIRHYVTAEGEGSGTKKVAIELGSPEASVLRSKVSDAFIKLTALAELAHLQESGLSEFAYQQIVTIEKEANRLMRTFGWMYGEGQRANSAKSE